MSDDELERIRIEKMKKLMVQQAMPKEIINIQAEEQFRELLNKYKDKIIIIDFWATWCAPCRIFAPVFEKLHQEYQEEFIFTKINVDEQQRLAAYYGITGIPTTLFIKNGNVIHKAVGAMNYDMMKNILMKLKSGDS
ncbi:MAG: thioredoxin [Promethearchaeota archaeon]